MEDKTSFSQQSEEDRSAYRGRSPMNGWQHSPFFKLMVAAPILAVIVALGLIMWRGDINAGCDKAVARDVSDLTAAFVRLRHEMIDVDSDHLWAQLSEEHISYTVGPYYGWGGTDITASLRRCKIRIKMSGREIHGCSKLRSRPSGKSNKTYIYRVSIDSGRDLPVKVGVCTGKRYGYPMYTSSMLHRQGDGKYVLGRPKGVAREYYNR